MKNILVLTFMLLILACKHEPDASTLPDVCYSRDIKPLLINRCAKCHGGQTGEEGDLDLKDYSGTLKIVNPGKPDKSSLYQAITNNSEEMMPPSPDYPLSKDERTIIYSWIKLGAKNDTICK
jgi:hypothetical protein